jgi:ferritin-like metal-binding protein YciE
MITTLKELFVEQLQDLYSAETQLIKALPAMAKAAHDTSLKEGFTKHLEQTKEHAARLEKILQELDEDVKGKKCLAMEGLVKEGKETISEKASPEVKDAALIAAAQRVEHYEIAGYGTVRTFAKHLGLPEAVELLQLTLDEETKTDVLLSEAAELVNVKALEPAPGKSKK